MILEVSHLHSTVSKTLVLYNKGVESKDKTCTILLREVDTVLAVITYSQIFVNVVELHS